MTNQNQVTV